MQKNSVVFKTCCWFLLCDSGCLWRAGTEGAQMEDAHLHVPGILA